MGVNKFQILNSEQQHTCVYFCLLGDVALWSMVICFDLTCDERHELLCHASAKD